MTITFLRIIIVETYLSFLGLLMFRYISNAKFLQVQRAASLSMNAFVCILHLYKCLRIVKHNQLSYCWNLECLGKLHVRCHVSEFHNINYIAHISIHLLHQHDKWGGNALSTTDSCVVISTLHAWMQWWQIDEIT